MKFKLKKKEYATVILFIVMLIIASNIFSDWENFKAGLFGLNPK